MDALIRLLEATGFTGWRLVGAGGIIALGYVVMRMWMDIWRDVLLVRLKRDLLK